MPGGIVAQAGPDAVQLTTPVELRAENLTTVAEFTVQEGASERFVLSWFPSYDRPGRTEDAHAALARTQAWWRDWSGRCSYRGEHREEVLTSLIVLKALTDQVTGAIVAAPTTSLPEDLGGERNWDYRYTWLRDSVLTLNALLAGGYTDEALAFSDAVFRATAGQPDQAQIMYGVAGERGWRNTSWTGCPATSAPDLSGSATRPRASSSSTCTARSSGSAGRWRQRWASSPSDTGGSFAGSWTTWKVPGRNPTTACGRPAGRADTTPSRR